VGRGIGKERGSVPLFFFFYGEGESMITPARFSREEKVNLSMACFYSRSEFENRLKSWTLDKRSRADYKNLIAKYARLEEKLDNCHNLTARKWGL
jgi:hypothetical protein